MAQVTNNLKRALTIGGKEIAPGATAEVGKIAPSVEYMAKGGAVSIKKPSSGSKKSESKSEPKGDDDK